MSRAPQDKAERPLPPDHDGLDDIEILEVVGLDEDGEPILASDPDDVEVVFDGGEAESASGEEARLKEQLLRLQADFENFKKRIDRERFEHLQYALAGLVGRILPVLDNFERAMAVALARPGSSDDGLLAGVALIKRQLLSELEAEGLRVMETVGETFDPIRHEAVATDPDSPVPPHTVTEELQRGYFLHDRVLRPALVRVRVDGSESGTGPDERKET